MKNVKNSGRKTISLVKALISFLILSLAINSFGCFSKLKLKTDQQLIQELQTRQGKLNQLVKMLQEDNQLTGNQSTLINAENLQKQGISPQRTQEYEKLWRELNINDQKLFLTYSKLEGLRIPATSDSYEEKTSSGKIVYDLAKGFCWFPNETTPKTVDNLENHYAFDSGQRHQDSTAGSYYRQVEGNWYIYLVKSVEAV